MDDDQQFCLRWNNHQSTLISVFDTLLENGTLVDCTLAAEGKFLKAHKVVLSACSPYFATLLSQQYDKHPIFILKDVKFQELRAMMDYMYRGEVNISQDQLAALLKAAESLQIKGLSDNRSSSSSSSAAAGGLHQQQQKQQSETTAAKSLQPPVPANKASGLTIENKRPLKSELLDSDVSGSREGSASPTSRKRKKVRRRSVVDTNNVLIDNHDQHSNSSSHSIHTGTATATGGQVAAASGAGALSSAVSGAASNSSANVLSAAAVAAAAAIKKTETVQQGKVQSAAAVAAAEALKQIQKQQAAAAAAAAAAAVAAQSSDDEDRCGRESIAATTEHDDGNDLTDNEHDGGDGASSVKSVRHRRDGGDGKGGSSSVSDLLLPKNEYDDVQDENVEDLTLDDEELMDELDQAGPSHGGDASSQGYAQWPLDREQNEAFIAAQDAAGGQHRDAQDILPIKTAGGSSAESGTVSLSLGATGIVGKRINSDSGSTALGTSGTAIVNSGTAGGTTISIVKFDSSKAAVIGGNVEEPKAGGGAAPTKKMTSGTVVGAGKLSHPRIKYSRAKNPYASTGGSLVSSTVTLPILTIPTVPHASSLQGQETTPTTASTIAVSDRPLLNFSLSRKLNTSQAPQQHVTITGGGASTTGLTTISAIQQLPVVSANLTTPRTAVAGVGGGGTVGNITRYTVNEYETAGSNTSVHSADFPTGVIDELDYSVIDDIDLSDEVQTNYGHLNVVGGQQQQQQHHQQQQQQQQQQQSMQNPPALVPVSSSKASSDVENNGSQSDEDEDGEMEHEDDGMLIEEDDEHELSIPRTLKLRKSDTGSDGGSANTGGSTGKLLNASMVDSKYGLLANTNIMKNFEYTVNESSVVSSVVSDTDDGDSMRQYICRHCGKRYRWKSTLRRHENVECGGKEASHQCPYCTYKAKQRGNLGVHIRKHHAEMPQLESRRRSNKSRDSI